MRHTKILIQQANGKFDCYHVTSTPGIGLKYSFEKGWDDPREATARLLAMIEVGQIRSSRIHELDGSMKGIKTRVSKDWNCQNWVREALNVMAQNGLITVAEKEAAINAQKDTIKLPFTTEAPNKQALRD